MMTNMNFALFGLVAIVLLLYSLSESTSIFENISSELTGFNMHGFTILSSFTSGDPDETESWWSSTRT